MFLVGLIGGVVLITGEFRWDYVFGAYLIFLLVGLAFFDSLAEMSKKKRFWCEVAEQTGLECHIGNFFLGFPVNVYGTYRNRNLSLFIFKYGKGQIPSTQIDLTVENPVNATLRLRGPFDREQTASDKVLSDLFGAADAREFGSDERFFIRSRPIHLVTGMFRSGSLRDNLLKLKEMVNIELDGQKLRFDQLGIIDDVEYLHFLFDLLSDVADMIDHGGYIKLTSTSDEV